MAPWGGPNNRKTICFEKCTFSKDKDFLGFVTPLASQLLKNTMFCKIDFLDLLVFPVVLTHRVRPNSRKTICFEKRTFSKDNYFLGFVTPLASQLLKNIMFCKIDFLNLLVFPVVLTHRVRPNSRKACRFCKSCFGNKSKTTEKLNESKSCLSEKLPKPCKYQHDNTKILKNTIHFSFFGPSKPVPLTKTIFSIL